MFAPSSDLPSQQVEITLSCENLPKMDTLSHSDPFAIVTLVSNGNATILGQTEVIKDTPNPTFATAFTFKYEFENIQNLKIEVFDHDKKGQHDQIGTVLVPVGRLSSSHNQMLSFALNNSFDGSVSKPLPAATPKASTSTTNSTTTSTTPSKKVATLTIYLEDCSENRVVSPGDVVPGVEFSCSAEKLAKMDLFSSDPYLVIERIREHTKPAIVARTEIIKANLNPTWEKRSIGLYSLCRDSEDSIIRFRVMDWDKKSADDLIGYVDTTLADLKAEPDGKVLTLVNPESKKLSFGTICIKTVMNPETRPDPFLRPPIPKPIVKKNKYTKFRNPYSWIAYLTAGLHFEVVIGLDFTGSNGFPSGKTSLHYVDQNATTPGHNPYQDALRSVLAILSQYTADDSYHMYSYGHTVGSGQDVQVAYHLGKGNKVKGIDGVLQCYSDNIFNVTFSCMSRTRNQTTMKSNAGDDFYPLIDHVANKHVIPNCQNARGKLINKTFTVLLLLIDGDSFDIAFTKNSIVKCSLLPMCIITIGIGRSQFCNLSAFDADDTPLKDRNGIPAIRDIVQFCRMNSIPKGTGVDPMAPLRSELLAEMPQSVGDYCALHGLTPYDIALLV